MQSLHLYQHYCLHFRTKMVQFSDTYSKIQILDLEVFQHQKFFFRCRQTISHSFKIQSLDLYQHCCIHFRTSKNGTPHLYLNFRILDLVSFGKKKISSSLNYLPRFRNTIPRIDTVPTFSDYQQWYRFRTPIQNFSKILNFSKFRKLDKFWKASQAAKTLSDVFQKNISLKKNLFRNSKFWILEDMPRGDNT